jgi:Phage capsid family
MDLFTLKNEAGTARFEARKALQALMKARGGDRQAAETAFDAAASSYEHARLRAERAIELDSSDGLAFSSVRVGKEPHTYRQGGEHSFLLDQRRAARGDGSARERLERHGRELLAAGIISKQEARAIGDTAGKGGELAAPAYMMEWLVTFARSGRPYVEAIAKRPLPASGEVHVPSIAGGAEAAAQKDLGKVEEKEPSTADLEEGVVTLAGDILCARQLFDRADPGLADATFFPDLGQAVLAKCDAQALTGSGEGGNLLGVLAAEVGVNEVTFTSESPTLAELAKAVSKAKNEVWKGVHLPPNIVVFHPTRWEWICEQVDESKRPLVLPQAFPAPPQADGRDGVTDVPAGIFSGLHVVLDPNVPTNLGEGEEEDRVIVQRAEESWWLEPWPSALRTRIAEDIPESSEGMLRLQAYQYGSVLHKRRPKGISVVSGTGLIVPTL